MYPGYPLISETNQSGTDQVEVQDAIKNSDILVPLFQVHMRDIEMCGCVKIRDLVFSSVVKTYS